ncbi:hypothetical protein SEA_BONUM_11 [Gordonia phage Bonum]|uniref:Uncharacterized protein n=1 Tax=Gordonia phage Kabluna TaxID=2041511 RepID=A0A2D1GCV9_9CAUD|nr:hypothetical protein KNT75_gp11 [Gordonia phage Kabluna]ATN89532.1 hypothetical protein SEA_KABLUNA_11 [Gordonia phage Kabluna]QXN73316.1 hypothetical protein SEA_BONUM_11 [Gordonia phage Bonum]
MAEWWEQSTSIDLTDEELSELISKLEVFEEDQRGSLYPQLKELEEYRYFSNRYGQAVKTFFLEKANLRGDDLKKAVDWLLRDKTRATGAILEGIYQWNEQREDADRARTTPRH